MPRSASVNYHLPGPGRQAYRIDAGEVGRLVSPEHVVTRVSVLDVRRGEASVTFADDSVAFARSPTSVSSFLDGDGWRQQYERELSTLLERELRVCEVVCFDHTVRVDDPHAERKPARNVHTDYSPEGAHRRIVDILGEARASE